MNQIITAEAGRKEDRVQIEKCLAGDCEAFEMLIKKYQISLISLAFSITSQIEDARDIVQESFFRAYMNLPGFNPALNFKSWIMRITYNCAIDHIRKRNSFLKYFNRKIEEGPSIKKSYQLVNDSEIFSPHLKKLKAKERAILFMKFDYNHSAEEIGTVMKCSPKTVRVHLFNTKKKLKKNMANPGEAADVMRRSHELCY